MSEEEAVAPQLRKPGRPRKTPLDRAREEAQGIRNARDVYGDICEAFEKDFKTGKSYAYSRYISALMRNARVLVPNFLSCTEHMKLVNDAAGNIKANEGTSQDDPREVMAQWLRGDKELTRIPFERTQ